MTKKPTTSPASNATEVEQVDPKISLEQELDRQIGDLVPQKARQEILRRVTSVVVSEVFSGPIAHPRHLREYEEIHPGSANRIITMAEERASHIIETESRFAKAEVDDARNGMRFGAAIFILLILAALIVALVTRDPVLSGLFLGATVLGGLSLFFRSQR